MEKKELVCITCPMSCHLEVTLNEMREVVEVKGNSCPRGDKYARKELTHPERMLTSVVKISGAVHKMLPVISSKPIPKDLIFEVMKEINQVSVTAPVKINDVIIENVLGTGVDILASRSM